MDSPDPFTGYSVLLRVLIFGVVPGFTLWQFFRLRRALHVFQLEGYKRRRFLDWCRANSRRALWLEQTTAKKPLAMTGRAWRILVVATVLTPLLILVPAGVAHVALSGWPTDVLAFLAALALVFYFSHYVLVASDLALAPVQHLINQTYLRRAARKLEDAGPVVIGVTGSFGKTSTKFAIEQLLGNGNSVLATPGSYNTPLGVCRTINERLQAAHRYFVVEMGAYGEGEIAELSWFVHPQIGVLTAIGPAHLERFGSIDAIRRAKYELIESLPDEGVAVMNVDDSVVRELAGSTRRLRVIRYGLDPSGDPEVTATDVQTSARGTTMRIAESESGGSIEVTTRLVGRHAVGHILAGVAVAVACGRRLEELGEIISSLRPVEHRLQLLDGAGGVTVVDDAYNSNPEGAAAALEVLEALPGGKKVVVTPGIIELGPMQADANRTFGRRAGAVADVVIVVARLNREALVSGVRAAGERAEVIVVDTLAQATKSLEGLLGPGDVVLFENDLPDQFEG